MRNDQVELSELGLEDKLNPLQVALENLFATGSTAAFGQMTVCNEEYKTNHVGMNAIINDADKPGARNIAAIDIFSFSELQEVVIHAAAYKAGFKDAFKTMLRILID